MDQRLQFVRDVEAGIFAFCELCARYGISRKTGYKWVDRYYAEGKRGLLERSRAPKSCPHRTDDKVVATLLELRRKYGWGPRKLLWIALSRRLAPEHLLPAPSTVVDILRRHGLLVKRRHRRPQPLTDRPRTAANEPNDVWTIDFKGQFPTQDRRYCYPLTVADDCSRFLLACQGLLSIEGPRARPVLERTFRTYGLPDVIRTDNGPPFATTALGRLSKLSVWWIKLDIKVERIPPATPSANGRHERMHRTLKQECTRPPAQNLRDQQTLFDCFRQRYNVERPHEGIDMATPASLYRPSTRPFPARLPEITYPGHYHLRTVGGNGAIRWHSDTVFLTNALVGEPVGLHEVDDGIWSIEFAHLELGRYDERHRRFHPGGATGPTRLHRELTDEP